VYAATVFIVMLRTWSSSVGVKLHLGIWNLICNWQFEFRWNIDLVAMFGTVCLLDYWRNFQSILRPVTYTALFLQYVPYSSKLDKLRCFRTEFIWDEVSFSGYWSSFCLSCGQSHHTSFILSWCEAYRAPCWLLSSLPVLCWTACCIADDET
jgi:hypothetical protein